jgi:leucyl/phenylalanyl-tRNA--protein transferase
MPVYLLSDEITFPPPHLAEKDGLLAVGGDLSQKRLLLAYKMGIFPWYSDGDPILWWSPDPRLVLFPEQLNLSKSLKKILNKKIFRITMDEAFREVITACAHIRQNQGEGTWIGSDMIEAYCRLHEAGFAHSVESWQDGKLCGGLYGVSLGGSFFGESMFAHISNASKVALVFLARHLKQLSFDMIDCQVRTEHMVRMGAVEVPRQRFLLRLEASVEKSTLNGDWTFGQVRTDN